MQKPTIGRIVHYHSYGTPGGEYQSKPVAAIVTWVSERDLPPELWEKCGFKPDDVGLCILNPTGLFFNQCVPYSEDPKPGHWSWPPRQEPQK